MKKTLLLRQHNCRFSAPNLICIILLLFFLLPAAPAAANKGIYDWAFVSLDYARKERVLQLQRFCERIHKLARQAAEDRMLKDCFLINLAYDQACLQGQVPIALTEKVETLKESFSRYYVDNYFSFYDIVFVNRQGRVIFSLRREYKTRDNLLLTQDNPLSLALRKGSSTEVFVDFHDYGPSREPASFFIEPVLKDQEHVGWIVLQCAINKVNAIFSGTENLGQTGETFLVNQQGLMLTESNFFGSSTILKKKLDDRNIKTKFAEGQGHRAVIDYRGHHALSSFAVVEFMQTQWLVVAKVDRGEIITTHYARHRKYYADRLQQTLDRAPVNSGTSPGAAGSREVLRIDMDEFARAADNEELCTFGIATCTGLIAAFPGKFAYMAHISPIDRIYGFAGTNLLGQIIKKIKSFDIYPCEKRSMVFTLIAPHQESFSAAIDKLVDEGFFLSQINLLYNPTAVSASISYSYSDNQLRTFWKMRPGITPEQFFSQVESVNLGRIIQTVMEEDNEKLTY
ncbi:MAG: cache domain-containing protein [Deltaproteobacteria bacterium]|nr:cache domain-containing protein [Deltaproteobacteria bacterium]